MSNHNASGSVNGSHINFRNNSSTSSTELVPLSSSGNGQSNLLSLNNGPLLGMNNLPQSPLMNTGMMSNSAAIHQSGLFSGQPNDNPLSTGSSNNGPISQSSLLMDNAASAAAIQMEMWRHWQYLQALGVLSARYMSAGMSSSTGSECSDNGNMPNGDMTSAMMSMMNMSPYMAMMAGGMAGLGGMGFGYNGANMLSPMLANGSGNMPSNIAAMQAMMAQSNPLMAMMYQSCIQAQQQQQAGVYSSSQSANTDKMPLPEPLQYGGSTVSGNKTSSHLNNNLKQTNHSHSIYNNRNNKTNYNLSGSSSNNQKIISSCHSTSTVNRDASSSGCSQFHSSSGKSTIIGRSNTQGISGNIGGIGNGTGFKETHRSPHRPVTSITANTINNNSNSSNNNGNNHNISNTNNSSTSNRSKRTVDYQRHIVESFYQEGMSIRIFCKKYDLAPTTFCRWKNKYMKLLNLGKGEHNEMNSSLIVDEDDPLDCEDVDDTTDHGQKDERVTNYLQLLGEHRRQGDKGEVGLDDEADDDDNGAPYEDDEDEVDDLDISADGSESGKMVKKNSLMKTNANNDNQVEGIGDTIPVTALIRPACIDEQAEIDVLKGIQEQAELLIQQAHANYDKEQKSNSTVVFDETTARKMKGIIRKLSFDAAVSTSLRRHILPSGFQVHDEDIKDCVKYFVRKINQQKVDEKIRKNPQQVQEELTLMKTDDAYDKIDNMKQTDNNDYQHENTNTYLAQDSSNGYSVCKNWSNMESKTTEPQDEHNDFNNNNQVDRILSSNKKRIRDGDREMIEKTCLVEETRKYQLEKNLEVNKVEDELYESENEDGRDSEEDGVIENSDSELSEDGESDSATYRRRRGSNSDGHRMTRISSRSILTRSRDNMPQSFSQHTMSLITHRKKPKSQ